MKDVLEANPFVSMQPHEQIQRYRVRSPFKHYWSVPTCLTSGLLLLIGNMHNNYMRQSL